jgi:hypothetical protein
MKFLKKATDIFLLLAGLFCFYACVRQVFVKNQFDYTVVAVAAFGIVLISVAITGFFSKAGIAGMFEALAEYKAIRYLYALGSVSFALTCAILVYDSFGLNLITFAGILGVLFFGFGCLVILFYDYRKFYEKWFE